MTTENKPIKNLLTRPGSFIFFIVVLGGVLLNSLPLLLLGALGWISYFTFQTIFRNKNSYDSLSLEDLSLEVRIQLKPLSKSYQSIQEQTQSSTISPWVKLIAEESLQEAKQIFESSKKLLQQQQHLKKIEQTSPSDEIKNALLIIDERIKIAQDTLAELNTKIILAALHPEAQTSNEEEFQQMILRLKNLSTTLTESQELFEEQTHGTQ